MGRTERKITGGHHTHTPLIEPPYDVLVCLGAVPRVDVHRHGEQLSEGAHGLEQDGHYTSPLDRLNGAG